MANARAFPWEAWKQYAKLQAKIQETAADKMAEFIERYGLRNREAAIQYAYWVIGEQYGAASAEAACEMYEIAAEMAGVYVPPAEPAEPPTPEQIAKFVDKAAAQSEANVPAAVGNMVKRMGADTTLKNAARDGAEWAWVPVGDTCAYCRMLASRGWRRQSKKSKAQHAEHIHNRCDCQYAVRFNGQGGPAGYDPDKYLKEYKNAPLDKWNTPDGKPPAGHEDAEEDTWKNRVKAMRRADYAENADEINAQKRAAYETRKEREGLTGAGGGGKMETEKLLRIPAVPASTVTRKVEAGEYSLRLTDQSYNKHAEGHRDYERYAASRAAKGQTPPSILTISKEEAQRIINEQSGTGIIKVRNDGSPTNIEMITCDKEIGRYYSHGEWHKTNKATIHHGSGGSHLVPDGGKTHD